MQFYPVLYISTGWTKVVHEFVNKCDFDAPQAARPIRRSAGGG
jgi:hypothetical protein